MPIAELLVPILVAIIVGGPAWFVTRQTRSENSRDHGIVANLLSDVIGNQAVADEWREGHTEVHEELNEKLGDLTAAIETGSLERIA